MVGLGKPDRTDYGYGDMTETSKLNVNGIVHAVAADAVTSVPIAALPPTLNANRRLDRWLTINAEGTVTVRTGKVEIGQGIVSAKEQVRFDRTRITSRTWEDYPVITFSEAPKIDIVLNDRPEHPSLGVGEGMVGPTAAAIANAVSNAMGIRVRDLPLTRERIIAALLL